MSLKDIPFLTHEVGSLRKPRALLAASANRELTEADFADLDSFASLIGLDSVPSELIDLLKQAGSNQKDKIDFHTKINRWRVELNIRYKESTGIDLIDAGEWMRREMYQHVIDNEVITGIELQTHVRSFDYNFWRPGVYIDKLDYNSSSSLYLEEYKWAKEIATKPLKVCLTSFNTVAEWTIQGSGSFDEIIFELIDAIFIPETIKLLNSGVNWLQFDEPALTTYPDHVNIFTEAWNYFATKIKSHLKTDTILGIHNCFSDYNLLWPILPELKHLNTVTLEFANRDSWNLGVNDSTRQAYQECFKDIQNLYEVGFNASLALGVLPVHTDHETSPELIRDRLLYINKIVNNPNLVYGAPDCGLRQRSLPVAHKLLKNLVAGAKLARKSLNNS
jgi:5-methyltetrahydropteroyltriglutamate--homocysteine methyltransferase